MTFGKFSQRLFVYFAVTTAAFAQSSSILFRLPGSGSGQTHLEAYPADQGDLQPLLSTTGPVNASEIIPVPSTASFYVISDGAVQSLNLGTSSFQAINGVLGTVNRARITPDGRYLMVMGDNFYVVNTANNSVIAVNVGVTSQQVVDVTFSADSRFMYMLRNQSGAYSMVVVDLSNFLSSTSVDIPFAGLSLAMSPNGQLYVAAQDGIGEYNPQTMQRVATIPITGRPSQIRFSPDGTRAYFANLTPEFGGRSIQSFRTTQRDVTGWPLPNTVQTMPRFSDVLVTSNDTVYALDRTAATLWRIFTNPLNGSVVTLPNIADTNQIFSAAISNETPQANFIYLLAGYNGAVAIKRVSLRDMTLAGQYGVTDSTGILQVAAIAPQVGATYLTKFGDFQSLPNTGGTVRVAVRLTDSLNRPVFNHQVIFSTPSPGVVISNTLTNTGSDGLAQTYVSVPGQPGIYTVSMVAAQISDTFQIRVLDTTTGGGNGGDGGGGTTAGTITAIRGDGMLVGVNQISSPDWSPLTVQVRDQNGNVAPGVPVDFQLTSGPGAVASFALVTDENGLAKAIYYPGQIPVGSSYDTAVVQAHSAVGDATFKVVVYGVNQTNSIPTIQVSNPPTFQVTGTRGDVVPNAYQAIVTARITAQGIPNVTMRVAAAGDFTADGPGTCVNDTHSDINGITTCDLKISCSATDVAPVQIVIGEFVIGTGAIIARPAGGRKLTVVEGNNQAGNAGAVLNRLVAKVTDSCSNAVSGQDVVWTVTQGSATLTQVVSRSGSDGTVSTGVTLGNSAGQITVRVSLANATPLDFTLTSNVVIGSVSLVNGGGQSATVGAAFANPIIFAVKDNNGNAVGSGITVALSADNGASLGSTSVSTDASGQVQTTVTAGSQSGTVTVTASVAGKTGTAQLQVRPPTLPIDSSSFTNAASRSSGLVACGLITLTGAGLAPAAGTYVSGVSAFGPWNYNVAGVSIRINSVPAPIQVVANQNGVQSVNFQTPCETQPGLATAVVSVNGTDTTVTNIPVFAAQPGIFTYSLDNKSYGAVIRIKDGSYITPSNPAPTGEDYYLILTGLGQTTPAAVTNAAGLDQQIAITTIVGVNNAGVPSQAGRYLTGNTGIYYIRFTIPRQAGVATGTILRDVPLAAAAVINGQAVFGNPTLLPAIQQQ